MHISNDKLAHRLYKELLQINKKKADNNKKWYKRLNKREYPNWYFSY